MNCTKCYCYYTDIAIRQKEKNEKNEKNKGFMHV